MQKLTFIFYGFGSTGFLSFLSPLTLLTSIPYFLYSFLSTNTAYYALGYQYPAMLLPAIYVSSTISVVLMPQFIQKFGNKRLAKKNWKITIYTLLVLLIIGGLISASVDPISSSPLYKPVDAFSTYHNPHVGQSSQTVQFLSNNIPRSSTILTQNNLFPFFSLFSNSFSTPWSPGVNNTTANNFQFIIGDYSSPWIFSSYGKEPSISSLINRDLGNHTYGIYAEGGAILAIKKGYNGSPVYMRYINKTFYPNSLKLDSGRYLKNGSIEASEVNGSFIWNGPYIPLLPGTYSVSFNVGIENFSISDFLTIDISSSGGTSVIYQKNITNSSTQQFFTVSTTIKIILPVTAVEFRGYGDFSGTAFLNKITLQQTNA